MGASDCLIPTSCISCSLPVMLVLYLPYKRKFRNVLPNFDCQMSYSIRAAISKYHRLRSLETTGILFSQFWKLSLDRGDSMVGKGPLPGTDFS